MHHAQEFVPNQIITSIPVSLVANFSTIMNDFMHTSPESKTGKKDWGFHGDNKRQQNIWGIYFKNYLIMRSGRKCHNYYLEIFKRLFLCNRHRNNNISRFLYDQAHMQSCSELYIIISSCRLHGERISVRYTQTTSSLSSFLSWLPQLSIMPRILYIDYHTPASPFFMKLRFTNYNANKYMQLTNQDV